MILATDSTTNLYESPFHLTLQCYLDNLTKSENPTKTFLKIKIRKNIVGAFFDRSSFDFTFSLFKFLLILILELSVAWNFNDIFLAFMISRITIWNWLLISCQLTTALHCFEPAESQNWEGYFKWAERVSLSQLSRARDTSLNKKDWELFTFFQLSQGWRAVSSRASQQQLYFAKYLVKSTLLDEFQFQKNNIFRHWRWMFSWRKKLSV